jgi:O-antigen/teichoic acid export membrane protein
MLDLRGKAVRGGLWRLIGQGASLLLKLTYLAVLARLLTPNDFGLVAMVTALTGVFELFTSAGLSAATVQRQEISDQQISQLFWVNMLVGGLLALACVASASLIANFYHDPRLYWVVVAMAPGFLINAAGVQHSALLQRELRYLVLSTIDTSAQLCCTALGIVLALAGFGYWSLVISTLSVPAVNTAGFWLATSWVPRLPRRGVEIRPMLYFGGTVTLNSIVVYVGYNLEKVLLGRFWGADALGLYTRAVQLTNLPVSSINAAVGGVFFSVLSRLQNNPSRFRSFFLKGYSAVMAVTMPATLFSAMFANDIVAVVLGANWAESASIFRLMSPTIMVFGIINPLGWVLLPVGRQKRSLQIALVLAPLVMASYLLGLPYGPNGVAFCYSAAMLLWVFPHVVWCLHDMPISVSDLVRTIAPPLLAGSVAAGCAFALCAYSIPAVSPALRLAVGGITMGIIYSWILLFLMGQLDLYLDVFSAFRRPSGVGV